MGSRKHYVLSHVNVIDVEKGKVIPNQSVEIKEGKIVRILPEIVEETE
jgi:hypothetical protein